MTHHHHHSAPSTFVLGSSSTKNMSLGRRWWWCVCVYFVFVLVMESRAFMLKAGYAPKIKAECLSWLRPQYLPPSPSSFHPIMNSLSRKIASASSFDGGTPEMEDPLHTVEIDLREASDTIKKVEMEIQDVGTNLQKLEKKISDVEKEIIDARKAEDKEELTYLRDKEKQLRDKEKQLRDEKNKLIDQRNKLLDKEKQLRDKENKLIDQRNAMSQAPGPQIMRSEAELLKWLTQWSRRSGPQNLVKGLGRSFPLQGRQSALDKIWEAHEKRYDARTEGDRRLHPILTFMGQSGVGKSRLLEEHHGALLARAKVLTGSPTDTAFAQALRKAHVDVRVTFGNGSGWQEDESARAAVAIRMLHSYFAGDIGFTSFRKRFREFLGIRQFRELTVSEAGLLIRADMLQRGEMEDMDNLVLVLGIDEIDKVLIRDSDSPKERRRYLTPLIRALGEVMCGNPSQANSNVFLCPLVAGVVVGEVKEVISESSYLTEPLLPLPLNEKEVYGILKSRRWAPDVFKDPELGRCLADLGGVPLILEAFVEKLESRYPQELKRGGRGSISFRDIREETKAYMLEKIAPTFASKAKTLKELLLEVLWNREPLWLDSRFGDTTVESLQASGVLALNPQGRVLIPIIYLELIAQSTLKRNPSLSERRLCGLALKVLSFESTMGWEKFEVSNQDYFALRMALAYHYGYQSMTLQELHEGAWMEESAGHARVRLDPEAIGTVGKLSTRYPQSKQDLELGVVYRNADGAACDLVTALTLEGESSNKLLIFHECKHTRKPVGESGMVAKASDVKVALNKVESALAESGKENQPYALVFISNRPFARVKDSPLAVELERANLTNAVVIVRENCIDYVGPSFAPRFMGYLEPWEGVASEGGNEYLEQAE